MKAECVWLFLTLTQLALKRSEKWKKSLFRTASEKWNVLD